MSFWDLSDGESAAKTGGEYETQTGMEPIPAGSSVMAVVDQAKWATTEAGDRYVSLRWSVLAPATYENRKVFHKLWVTDHDPNVSDRTKAVAKTDKARKMLAAIDANAGGKLTARSGEPTDEDLALALIGKPMVITLMVWDSNTGGNGGNWVCAVAPKTKELKIGDAALTRPRRDQTTPGGARSGGAVVDDDEIPF